MPLSIEDDTAIHSQWLADGGLKKLITFDSLTPDSWVWEIGGYRGKWVEQISDKYNPWITVFEPVWDWSFQMAKMFSDNSKIRVENYGLGNKDRDLMIGVSEDSSGMYCPVNKKVVKIKSVEKVMGERLCDEIDLMKCNCEGGEYKILHSLIKTGLIKKFRMIIIQFHWLHETHPELRKRIQDELSKTHKQTLCYDWKFEYWERK